VANDGGAGITGSERRVTVTRTLLGLFGDLAVLTTGLLVLACLSLLLSWVAAKTGASTDAVRVISTASVIAQNRFKDIPKYLPKLLTY
jgi:hypothetical protein